MIAAEIARALGGAQRHGQRWRCRCPLHGGRSLELQEDTHRRVLVTCWAGCDRHDVLNELYRLGLLGGGRHHVRQRYAPLPPVRRLPGRAVRQHARGNRGPTWSCTEAALAFVGRAVALAPSDERRLDALRERARALAALVRDGEIAKAEAVDRCWEVADAYGVIDFTGLATVESMLGKEFGDA